MILLLACSVVSSPPSSVEVAAPVAEPAPEVEVPPPAPPVVALSDVVMPLAPGALPATLIESIALNSGCEIAMISLPALSRRVLATLPQCPEELLFSHDATLLVSLGSERHIIDVAKGTAVALPPPPARPAIDNPESWIENVILSDNEPVLVQSWGVGGSVAGVDGPVWPTMVAQDFRYQDGAWVQRDPGSLTGSRGTSRRSGESTAAGSAPNAVTRAALELAAPAPGYRQWTTIPTSPLAAWRSTPKGELLDAEGPVLLLLPQGWTALPRSDTISELHLEYHGHYLLVAGQVDSLIWDIRGPSVVFRTTGSLWFWPEELAVPTELSATL